jgi:hypothetical protein
MPLVINLSSLQKSPLGTPPLSITAIIPDSPPTIMSDSQTVQLVTAVEESVECINTPIPISPPKQQLVPSESESTFCASNDQQENVSSILKRLLCKEGKEGYITL